MDLIKLTHVNLRYFDGEGAGAAPAEGEGSGWGETGDKLLAEAAARNHKGASSQEVKLSYETEPEAAAEEAAPEIPDAGESVQEADVQTTSDSLEDKRRAYNDLIKGEYKDFFTEDTQRIIDRRFKETKDLESYKEANSPIIDMLMQRYGVNDAQGLMSALENDTAYWEEAADAAGMSVSQFMEFQKLERENKALLAQQEQMVNRQLADQQYAQWTREAEAMKAKYPGFDLAEEAKNPDFISLLSSNVPLEHAYRTIHLEEIMDQAVSAATMATQKQVTDNIRARGSRPQEAGLNSSNGIEHKVDVDKLTKSDIFELARRAERGEIISF